jgi:hypothetical protein
MNLVENGLQVAIAQQFAHTQTHWVDTTKALCTAKHNIYCTTYYYREQHAARIKFYIRTCQRVSNTLCTSGGYSCLHHGIHVIALAGRFTFSLFKTNTAVVRRILSRVALRCSLTALQSTNFATIKVSIHAEYRLQYPYERYRDVVRVCFSFYQLHRTCLLDRSVKYGGTPSRSFLYSCL